MGGENSKSAFGTGISGGCDCGDGGGGGAICVPGCGGLGEPLPNTFIAHFSMMFSSRTSGKRQQLDGFFGVNNNISHRFDMKIYILILRSTINCSTFSYLTPRNINRSSAHFNEKFVTTNHIGGRWHIAHGLQFEFNRAGYSHQQHNVYYSI